MKSTPQLDLLLPQGKGDQRWRPAKPTWTMMLHLIRSVASLLALIHMRPHGPHLSTSYIWSSLTLWLNYISIYIYIYIGRSRYVYNIYLKYQKIHFRREQKYQNFMCMCCLQAQHKPAVLLLINTVDNIYFAHTLERNENVKNGVVTL